MLLHPSFELKNKLDELKEYKVNRAALASKALQDFMNEEDGAILDAIARAAQANWDKADEGELPIRNREEIDVRNI